MMTRTLVAAGEPEPEPVTPSPTVSMSGGNIIHGTNLRITPLDSNGQATSQPWTSASATVTFHNVPADLFEFLAGGPSSPSEPYRTTAHVGEPIQELESGE